MTPDRFPNSQVACHNSQAFSLTWLKRRVGLKPCKTLNAERNSWKVLTGES